MKFKKKYYHWLINIMVFLVIIILVRAWQHRDNIEGVAPNISAVLLSGKPFDLYENKNRPLLVHFWATWCPVCKLEQSSIENIAKDHFIMTIAMQSGDNETVNQFMRDEKLSFNVINDESGVLSHSYKIKGVPVSFILNRENKIEFIEVGYTTEIGLRLRLLWAGL